MVYSATASRVGSISYASGGEVCGVCRENAEDAVVSSSFTNVFLSLLAHLFHSVQALAFF